MAFCSHSAELPWASQVVLVVKSPRANAEDKRDPWVGKVPRRRAWQPTPIFLPGERPGAEEPGGLQSIGSNCKGQENTKAT